MIKHKKNKVKKKKKNSIIFNLVTNKFSILFSNQFGIVSQVYDEIVHCTGMPNVKIGEIVVVVINNE